LGEELLFTVQESQAGSRLDRLVMQNIPRPAPSRSRVQDWIRKGNILLDGTVCLKPAHKLSAGQTVQVLAREENEDLEPVAGKLDIVYMDREMVVLNKPAGLSVHPSSSDPAPTLVHYLLYACPGLRLMTDRQRPGIVHRLDKDTTGLMVAALNQEAKEDLAGQFAGRRVHKTYLALVCGALKQDEGIINVPLARDQQSRARVAPSREGRSARTAYKVLKRDPSGLWSLVQVQIFTGRTHQIRVHFSHLNHPVLGDRIYGGTDWDRFGWKKRFLSRLAKRQLLHSSCLGIMHPVSRQWLEFISRPPRDFIRTLLWLVRKCQKVVVTGSAGCGKSSVLEYFRSLGFPVFSADKCVDDLYQPGSDGWLILRKRFGYRFTPQDDQPVDKKKLLAAVMQDSGLMDEIAHLIHPLVGHRLEEFWEKHADKRLALAEIPLWFESGMAGDRDCLSVGVFCPDFLRRNRVCSSRGWSPDVFESLDAMQFSQPEKIKRCQMVVDNSRDFQGLMDQVTALQRLLTGLRRKKAGVDYNHFKNMACNP